MESGATAAEEVPAPPPRPASYKDILQMLEQGKTPPGIRVCPLPCPLLESQANSSAASVCAVLPKLAEFHMHPVVLYILSSLI